MNNKILIGSIIAVVILVLVSFTGVVGYQTTKSSTIARASPLFSVRSKRAIDEETEDLTCDYVGNGEESILSIPKRNDGARSLKKAQRLIDIISRMDNKTFVRFLNLLTNQILKKNEHDNLNINEVTITIKKLRNNPDKIILDNSDKNYNFFTWNNLIIFPTICWFPGCIPVLILLIPLALIVILDFFLYCENGHDTLSLCTINP